MAGKLISILAKSTLTQTFASTGNQVTVLGKGVHDLRDAVSGVLLVRVASVSNVPTGGTFQVSLNNIMVMPDDPGTSYFIQAASSYTAKVTISPADVFPGLYVAAFSISSTYPLGPMGGVALQANYGSAAGTATIVLGVDLLIHDT